MAVTFTIDQRVIENFADISLIEKVIHKDDLSLASGYSGLILFFSQLQKTEDIAHSDEVIHHYVLRLRDIIQREGIVNLSLYSGATGIAFALQQASCEGLKYQGMLDSLHQFLLTHINSCYLDPLEENLRNKSPSFAAVYDVIQGLCGIGRYMIEYLYISGFEEIVRRIARAFVGLSQPLQGDKYNIPGWFMRPEDRLNAKNRRLHPRGTFNLGLAHGVTGVLAFLSIAWIRGIREAGQRESMVRIATWTREKSFQSPKGIVWPYIVGFEEEVEKTCIKQQQARDAWCYGAPGISRTLFLTGEALNDVEMQSFAKSAFQDIFLRSRLEWHLPGPTLCHGIAGLLLITKSMKEESYAKELEEILLTSYQEKSVWGFKDVEPSENGYSEVDKPGFLEGALGVWLALLINDRKWALPLIIDA